MLTAISHIQLRINEAHRRLAKVIVKTPLQYNHNLSKKYQCNVYLKREDLQAVRSYKIRGAYNMISSLAKEELSKGLVCASAGNHAQGFASSCRQLNVRGIVFMPVITSSQKINQTRMFGEDKVSVRLAGDNYDDCAVEAMKFAEQNNMTFIPPFDHLRIIEGQGTVAPEILEEISGLDFLFVPVGGGGLAAGVGSYFRTYSPKTRIVGLEPEGAASMKAAFQAGQPVTLESIDRFVDGAAVRRVGDLTFAICHEVLSDIVTVPEGSICTTILKLYNEDAIVVEPAGALSIAGLEVFAEEIKSRTVVCIVSGSNNDIDRMAEIKERSLQHEGLKHYFLINFAQRPGALKEFVNKVLGPTDDITRFEYMQKTNKEYGPALVGIELRSKADYDVLIRNFQTWHIEFTELNKNDTLFGYVV